MLYYDLIVGEMDHKFFSMMAGSDVVYRALPFVDLGFNHLRLSSSDELLAGFGWRGEMSRKLNSNSYSP